MPTRGGRQRVGFLARRRVPRLAATLADTDIGYRYRTDAARALADIGGEAAGAALLAHLHAAPWQVQRSVVVALGQVGDPRSSAALLRLLGETEGEVRAAVLAALRRTGLPPDLDPLIRGLGRPSGPEHAAAVMGELVDVFGDPLVQQLSSVAADPGVNSGVRLAALRTVVSRAQPGAAELVRTAAEDPSPELRRAAVAALPRFSTDERTVELVTARTKDEDTAVRRAAVLALSQVPDDPRATEALFGCLDDEDPTVRSHAFAAITARVGTPGPQHELPAREAVSLVVPFLRDDNLRRRQEAADLLARLGWEPPDDAARAASLAARGAWEQVAETGQPGVDVLLEWLERHDTGSSSRRAALAALLRVADSEVEAVTEAARSGSEMATRTLRWLAGSRRPAHRRAADALAQIRAQRLPSLVSDLRFEPDWQQPDFDDDPWGYDAWESQCWERRLAAASALAQLGDPRGLSVLSEAMLEGRAGALSALRRVGGPEAAQVLEEAGELDALAEVRAAPDFPGADGDL